MGTDKKIHVVIVIYAIIIILVNLVGVFFGFGDTSRVAGFLNDPDIDLSHRVIRYLFGNIAAGNLATIVLMAVAVIRRNRVVLATMFTFGFITATISTLILANAYGVGSVSRNIIRWVVLGLPQLIAAIVLLKGNTQKA